jgi:hypothetical protein
MVFGPPWFLLEEMPGNRTRLVVSSYTSARPRLIHAIQNFVFWEPAHWIMQTRQFANLERRIDEVESAPRRLLGPPERDNRVVTEHPGSHLNRTPPEAVRRRWEAPFSD